MIAFAIGKPVTTLLLLIAAGAGLSAAGTALTLWLLDEKEAV